MICLKFVVIGCFFILSSLFQFSQCQVPGFDLTVITGPVDEHLNKIKNEFEGIIYGIKDSAQATVKNELAKVKEFAEKSVEEIKKETEKALREPIQNAIESLQTTFDDAKNLTEASFDEAKIWVKTNFKPTLKKFFEDAIKFGKENIDEKIWKFIGFFQHEATKFCPGSDDIIEFDSAILDYYCLKPSSLLNMIFDENSGWGNCTSLDLDDSNDNSTDIPFPYDPFEGLPLDWFTSSSEENDGEDEDE